VGAGLGYNGCRWVTSIAAGGAGVGLAALGHPLIRVGCGATITEAGRITCDQIKSNIRINAVRNLPIPTPTPTPNPDL
jgi:hypothetical protein